MTSQHDSKSSGPERTITLNIRTEEEKHEMMREMLVDFLRVVHPREDGLLDTLYASYMLTETDNESLSGKDVLIRKDQARKLWVILNEVQLEDFISIVAPELCKMYPHIIPSRFVANADVNVTHDATGDDCQKTKCLRHAIQSRIRATSMADMLYSRNFLDFENYGDIISGNYEAEPVWDSIFSTFCERTGSEVQTLVDGLRELLHHYHMKIPADDSLKEIVTVGLHCTCESPMVSSPPVSVSVPHRKVGSWVRKTRFSLARSSATSKTNMPASTYSSRATRQSVSSHASSCSEAEPGYKTAAAPGDTVVTITETARSEENHTTEVLKKINLTDPPHLSLFLCLVLFLICGLYMMGDRADKTEISTSFYALRKGYMLLAEAYGDTVKQFDQLILALKELDKFNNELVKTVNGLVDAHNKLAKYVQPRRLLWQ